jgi:hypothetical protein
MPDGLAGLADMVYGDHCFSFGCCFLQLVIEKEHALVRILQKGGVFGHVGFRSESGKPCVDRVLGSVRLSVSLLPSTVTARSRLIMKPHLQQLSKSTLCHGISVPVVVANQIVACSEATKQNGTLELLSLQ